MRLTRRQTGGAGEIEEDVFWNKMWESSVIIDGDKIELRPLTKDSFFHKLYSKVVKNLNKKIEKANENSKIIIKPFLFY